MAFMDTITCRRCHKECVVACSANAPHPQFCGACAQEMEAELLKTHLDYLFTLSVEERLRRIETWVWEQGRIEKPFDVNELIG